MKELKRDIKEKLGGIDIEVEYDMETDYVIRGEKEYRWRRNRGESVECKGREKMEGKWKV